MHTPYSFRYVLRWANEPKRDYYSPSSFIFVKFFIVSESYRKESENAERLFKLKGWKKQNRRGGGMRKKIKISCDVNVSGCVLLQYNPLPAAEHAQPLYIIEIYRFGSSLFNFRHGTVRHVRYMVHYIRRCICSCRYPRVHAYIYLHNIVCTYKL